MATIQKKNVKGHTYWYIVESRRVNGKPRPVVLAYLGRIEDILSKINTSGNFELSSFSHGAVASLWKTASDYSIIDIMKKHLSPRERDGLCVAQSLLVAAIHRVIEPSSKKAFADWAKITTLPEIVGFDSQRITSQHFWDQMDTVTDGQIEKIQNDLTSMILEKQAFSAETLFFDTTNFFTFIDSQNPKCDIAQRGHNKQKRYDLKQFGLAMLVSKDYFIPLGCDVYRGNINDMTFFQNYLPGLFDRFKDAGIKIDEMTIVFDKGNNSEAAFKRLDEASLNFIASIPVIHQDELLTLATQNLVKTTVGEKTIEYYKTEKNLWGKKRTIVVYVSKTLKAGQLKGIEKSVADKFKALDFFKNIVNSKYKNASKKELETRVKNIIKGEYGDKIIDYTIKKYNGKIRVEYELNHEKYQYLTDIILGKRILVTTRHDWDAADVISGYWGQSHIEKSFRQLKNPRLNSIRPQYHWTDQKIKVHTFCCLIGFLLVQLMYKKVCEAKIQISREKMIERLSEVRKGRMIQFDAKNKKMATREYFENTDELNNIIYSTINA